MSAILQPNMPKSIIIATSFIIGEDTRKENVAPNGTPALRKPKNNGIALQVQNGVAIPKSAAKIFPKYLFFLAKIFLIFSGARNVLRIEIVNIILIKSKNIFIIS